MVAFDDDNMVRGCLTGLRTIAGTVSFSTSDTQVTVEDSGLTHVVAGYVTPNAVTADAETYSLTTGNLDDRGTLTIDRVVETGGTITSGGTVSFVAMGY
tara:strand:- start:6447 stop:6743 length:297 start_codon:yes stop_codon:yes gene_type:complete